MSKLFAYFLLLFFVCNVDQLLASTALRLTSSISGTVPFTAGLAFKKGDVLSSPTLELSNYQVVVKKLWNDGSVKSAIVSGYYSSVADTESVINVNFTGSTPSGTDLTYSDIQTAAPTASVQLGSIGTVTLSSLLSSPPKRTWISGPEMVECHYQTMVGSSTTLSVLFQVQLYKNGEIFIRAWVDNGFLDVTTYDESYVPTVIIGGNTVYDNGGSSLSHYKYERWSAEGWIGTSNPDLTIRADTSYLMQSKLVPNYHFTASEGSIIYKDYPSTSSLSVTSYTPLQQGDWSTSMGAGGYHGEIGLLPRWESVYLASGGASAAFRTMIANSKSLWSYPILRKASTTNDIPIISDWSLWTVNGTSGSGQNTLADSGGKSWETAHHPSAGYLSYIITGDYYYLDQLMQQAVTLYLCQWAGTGYGLNRILKEGETRGAAWAMRSVSQAAGIAPSSDVSDDIVSLLSNNIDYWKTIIDGISPEGIGYFFEASTNLYYSQGHGYGSIAPWQQHYFIAALGYGASIEPLNNMTNYNIVRDYSYRAAVGILGTSDTYCFNYASNYTVNTNDGSSTSVPPDDWYKTWKEVEVATASVVGNDVTWTPGECGNTLDGYGSGTPSAAAQMGFWGELLPAIAYAVQDGATGASDAWARLIGATNFSEIENSGFEDTPTWGIYPLSIGSPSTIGKRYRYSSISQN